MKKIILTTLLSVISLQIFAQLDNDGISQKDDVCPYDNGPESNFGCPLSISFFPKLNDTITISSEKFTTIFSQTGTVTRKGSEYKFNIHLQAKIEGDYLLIKEPYNSEVVMEFGKTVLYVPNKKEYYNTTSFSKWRRYKPYKNIIKIPLYSIEKENIVGNFFSLNYKVMDFNACCVWIPPLTVIRKFIYTIAKEDRSRIVKKFDYKIAEKRRKEKEAELERKRKEEEIIAEKNKRKKQAKIKLDKIILKRNKLINSLSEGDELRLYNNVYPLNALEQLETASYYYTPINAVLFVEKVLPNGKVKFRVNKVRSYENGYNTEKFSVSGKNITPNSVIYFSKKQIKEDLSFWFD